MALALHAVLLRHPDAGTARLLVAPIYADSVLAGFVDARDKGGRQPFTDAEVLFDTHLQRVLPGDDAAFFTLVLAVVLASNLLVLALAAGLPIAFPWLGLLGLTAVTVGVKYADLQHLAIFTAIAIATVKAALVLMYFMHIRYERRIFAVMIVVFLVTYGTFIGLTFVDYPFR